MKGLSIVRSVALVKPRRIFCGSILLHLLMARECCKLPRWRFSGVIEYGIRRLPHGSKVV
ncbi:hypothetical protein COCVIDRAFT_107226 [Bipolaris victoriae FI3]|uniref:Uncharacterized protein n=1 Tax=Bipolaris victoriae (strain FI3) TaxID=930091 RepID=W7EAH2_BIPV3|nr:hypothetical protein COCVIDRAFT_107226 [Bipolaris victoriae FI3]